MRPYLFVKRCHPNAKLPEYATDGASGLDIFAPEAIELPPRRAVWIPTGIQVQLDPGFEAQVRGRSGLAAKFSVLALHLGTIDADYRGEVQVMLWREADTGFRIEAHERLAQMVIAPVVRARVMEVVDLEKTKRGESGFGSTGR